MENNTQTRTPWQRFIGLLKLERKDFLQISYYAIFEGIIALSLPLGIQAIINLLQSAQITASWVVLVILVTLGVAFSGLLKFMQIRIIETIQQRIFTLASFELSYRFPKIKLKELRNYYLPELANRFFDTLTIQKGLSKILIDVPSAILQILLALLLLSFYHPFFIVFGFLLLILIYSVFKFTLQKGLDTSLEESKNKYKVVHWLQEIARSVLSFKLSGKTSLALEKNDILVDQYLASRESHFKILKMQFIQMISFKVLVTAAMLSIGGFLVLNQKMNIGQFVASEIIILLVIGSVEKLILGLESFYDVLTSIEKLGQVVDKPLEPRYGSCLEDAPYTLCFDKVCYQSNPNIPLTLKDVSFTLHPGDIFWIHGDSGTGKSSLLLLIAAVIAPTSGNITVNNLALSSLQVSSYRASLGMSLSEETPFEGTIRENVTFGDTTITDKQIYWAFEHLGLLKFLSQQPQALDTILKPEGKQIPYTIAKKIILARAIVKKPKILILEDPLDQFKIEETQRIISFLTDPIHSWSIVVVSSNEMWEKKSNKTMHLPLAQVVIK